MTKYINVRLFAFSVRTELVVLRQAQHERGICGSILRQAQNHPKRLNFCSGTYVQDLGGYRLFAQIFSRRF